MVKFSEAYEKALAQVQAAQGAPQPAPRGPRKPLYSTAPAEAPTEPEGPDFWKDPLGAILDTISRPLYGSTNVATKAVDDTIEATKKWESGDPGGAVWDLIFKNPVLGAVSPALGLAQQATGESPGKAFAEGLTTQTDDKRRFFSDVIEESTDKVGAEFDPNYIDRVDNVYGPLKGGVGLAGDILLDPLSYVPIPLGAITKGARALKNAGKATVDATKETAALAKRIRSGGSVADEVVPEPVPVGAVPESVAAQEVATPQKVSPREAMTFEMPKAPQRGFNPTPIEQEIESALQEAIARPRVPKGVDDTPMALSDEFVPRTDEAVAPVEASPAAEPSRPTPQAIQQVVADMAEVTPAGTIPGVTTKVTRRQAQDAFLAVGSGKGVTPRRKAIYEYVVAQASAKSVPEAAPLPTPKTAPAAPDVPVIPPEQEAREIWAEILDKDIHIGETPLTKEHLVQALTMEKDGSLPKEWVDHLRYFRDEAQFSRDLKDVQDAQRSMNPAPGSKEADEAFEDAVVPAKASDELARAIEANGGDVAQAKKTIDTADALDETKAAAEAPPVIKDLSLEEVVIGSSFSEGIRKVLDRAEALVRAGGVKALPERRPVTPFDLAVLSERQGLVTEKALRKRQGLSLEEFREKYRAAYGKTLEDDYEEAFDRWVADGGLASHADANGNVRVEVEGLPENVTLDELLATNAQIREYTAKAQQYETVVEAEDIYAQIPVEDLHRLEAVNALFQRDIANGKVLLPGREATAIADVVEAWQYLLQKEEVLTRNLLGDAAFDFFTKQLKNPQNLPKKLSRLREMLEPDFGWSDLNTLRRARQGTETKALYNLLERAIPGLTKARERVLAEELAAKNTPAPKADEVVEEVVDAAPDVAPAPVPSPEPTSVPLSDAKSISVQEAADIAAEPSYVTPRPSTPEEVQSAIDVLEGRINTGDPMRDAVLQSAVASLVEVLGRDIVDVAKKAPFVTKTGVRRTDATPGEGFGWRTNYFNTPKQYSVIQAVQRRVKEVYDKTALDAGKKALTADKLFSKNRAIEYENITLETLAVIDKALDALGIPRLIGWDKDFIPLSLLDTYTALGAVEKAYLKSIDDIFAANGFQSGTLTLASMKGDVRLLLLHDGNGRVNTTNLLDAVHVMLRGGDDSEIFEALMNTKTHGVRSKDMPNNFAQGDRETFNLTLNTSGTGSGYHLYSYALPKIFPRMDLVPTGKNAAGNTYRLVIPGEDLATAMVGWLRAAQDDLAKKAVNNGWRGAQKDMGDAARISDEVTAEVVRLYNDPLALADFVRKANGEQIADDVIEAGAKTGASQTATDAASAMTRTSLGDDLVDDMEGLVSIEKASKKKKGKKEATQKAVAEESRKRTESAFDEVRAAQEQARAKQMLAGNPEKGIDDTAPLPEQAQQAEDMIENFDLSQQTWKEQQAGVIRLVDTFQRTFKQSYRHERIWGLTHEKSSAAQEYLGRLHTSLTDLARKHGKETIDEAFERVRMNQPIRSGDEVHETVAGFISRLWSPGEDGLFSNVLLHSTDNIELINEVLAIKFSGKSTIPQFDIGEAKNLSLQATGSTDSQLNFLAQQWRDWKVDDAADFLSRISDAAVTIAERKAIADNFVYSAKRWGLVSETPKPGFVNIHASGKSAFGSFVSQGLRSEGKTLYVDKDLAKELAIADVLTRTSRQMEGDLGVFVRKYLMPAQDAWKVAMTIYRPGHHVRNAIGDATVTWLVRGTRFSTKASKDAFKVMALGPQYTDVDLIKAIKSIDGEDALAFKRGDVVVSGKIGNSEVSLTAGEVLDALHKKGLRPTFRMSEELFEDPKTLSKYKKFIEKWSAQNTRFHDFAGGVSQARDHWSRAQHFLQIINQELKGGPFSGAQFRGVKSLDDLIDRAAREVKKYHPDASMLTPGESSYARAAIPFYTWFAKTLPAVLEASLRRPGRVIAIPKISYEAAVASGVNPDTIYDPFPQDQLFPSFLTEGALGPQFRGTSPLVSGLGFSEDQYLQANPGFANLDIYETAPGGDVWRGLLGMTSPFLRVPLELASGGSWGTGARINDASDYIDSTIPLVNYLSSITGTSVTGTLVSPLNLEGDNAGPRLDPQHQVEAGNKGGFGSPDSYLAMTNYLLGLGVQNLSRPSYINYAEFELKRGEQEQK